MSTAWQNIGISVPGVAGLGAAAGVLLAEGFVYAGAVSLALWAYLLTLVYCTLVAGVVDDALTPRALLLVAVFRLLNLGTPVFEWTTTLGWLALVYAAFVPALLVAARVGPPVRWNVRAALRWSPVAVGGGAALALVEYAILRPPALAWAFEPVPVALVGLVTFALVAPVEELLFRGVLQSAFQARLGRWAGVALASVVFAALHSGYRSPPELAFAFGLGLLLGWAYDRTESLALVTLVHGTLNVVLFAALPFLPEPLAALG